MVHPLQDKHHALKLEPIPSSPIKMVNEIIPQIMKITTMTFKLFKKQSN